MSDKELKRAVDIPGFLDGTQCVRVEDEDDTYIYKVGDCCSLQYWCDSRNEWLIDYETSAIYLLENNWYPVPDPSAKPEKEKWYRHTFIESAYMGNGFYKDSNREIVEWSLLTWDEFADLEENKCHKHLSSICADAPPWGRES